jgi:hypothetical protein
MIRLGLVDGETAAAAGDSRARRHA